MIAIQSKRNCHFLSSKLLCQSAVHTESAIFVDNDGLYGQSVCWVGDVYGKLLQWNDFLVVHVVKSPFCMYLHQGASYFIIEQLPLYRGHLHLSKRCPDAEKVGFGEGRIWSEAYPLLEELNKY